MSKATLLAVCLLGISSAIILRAAGHQRAGELAAATPSDRAGLQSLAERNDVVVVNSAAKADKLPVATPLNMTKVVAIEPQTAAPPDKAVDVKSNAAVGFKERKQAESVPVQTKITSWHWNARSNKITRK